MLGFFVKVYQPVEEILIAGDTIKQALFAIPPKGSIRAIFVRAFLLPVVVLALLNQFFLGHDSEYGDQKLLTGSC